MLQRIQRPFQPRLRTSFLISTALILALILVAGSVLLSLAQAIRAEIQRALQVNAYSTTVSQAYLELAQTLIAAEEAVETRDAYKFQERLLPRLTSLSQSQRALERILVGLSEDDPLRPYLLETTNLLQRSISTLYETQRLAREDQWPSVKLRLWNLHTLYTRSRTPLSTLIVHTREAAIQAREQASRLLLRLLLVGGGLVLFLALTLGGQALFTLSRLVRPLEQATARLAHFAQGDLSVRLPEPLRPLEMHQLARTFNYMADQIQNAQRKLEREVEARTADLRRRTRQLQAAAEVGRAVTSFQDLDQVLQEATRLISERFGFYHVGIFLLDPNGEYAVLQAANSPGGQRMLQRGHRLKVGEQGIVGYVTGTGKPRIALDVGADAVHFRNPDLPHTRSEMALPLRVGDRILGALDVQSTEPAAFAQEDISTLQLLADLLAVAINNANLLRQRQEALEDLQRAYAQLSQRGWAAFTQQRRLIGYKLDARGTLHPLQAEEEPPPPEETTEEPSAAETLTLPIQVRGTTVARLQLRKPAGQSWHPPEQHLLEQFSQRMGAALEGARLYAEAQRRAAQLQVAAEIARDASGTLDLDILLASAVHLIQERFGFYHASVFLIDESGTYAEIRESTGAAGAEMKRRRHRLAVGSASTVGQATATGQAVVINDTQASEIHRPNPLLPETRAELALPLKAGDEVIGALDVQSRRRQAFSQEDVQVLQILADQIAVAVVNARLFAEIWAYLEAHWGRHQVLVAATPASTVTEALERAVQTLHELRPQDLVALLTPEEQGLRVAAAVGHAPEVSGKIIPWGQGITGWVAQHRQALRVPWTAQDPRYLAGTPGVQSEMAIPLIYRDELLGVLDLESLQGNAYSESDQELFYTLATSLAAVLANLRLLEAARQRSHQLQLLNEITAAAASHTNQQDLIHDILPRLVQGLGGTLGIVALRQGPHQSLTPVAFYPEDLASQIPLTAQEVADLLNAYRTPQGVSVEAFASDALQRTAQSLGIQSALLIPLRFRGEPVGLIHLGFAETRAWTPEDLRLVEQMGRQISTSLEVARLFQQAVRRAERERLLTAITTRMRASNDPQEILQTAVRELQRALQVETTQVVILNPDDGAQAPPEEQE